MESGRFRALLRSLRPRPGRGLQRAPIERGRLWPDAIDPAIPHRPAPPPSFRAGSTGTGTLDGPDDLPPAQSDGGTPPGTEPRSLRTTGACRCPTPPRHGKIRRPPPHDATPAPDARPPSGDGPGEVRRRWRYRRAARSSPAMGSRAGAAAAGPGTTSGSTPTRCSWIGWSRASTKARTCRPRTPSSSLGDWRRGRCSACPAGRPRLGSPSASGARQRTTLRLTEGPGGTSGCGYPLDEWSRRSGRALFCWGDRGFSDRINVRIESRAPGVANLRIDALEVR